MNHWKPNMDYVEADMSFIVEMLMSVMAHPCDCPGCTMQKGRAVNAMTWLIGDRLDLFASKPQSTFDTYRANHVREHEVDADYEEVPDEVVGLCQRAVQDERMAPEKRAIIAGWLESLSA